MFENVPSNIKTLAFAVLVLAAPITFFSFFFGGFPAGAAALGAIFLLYMVLYFVVVKKYL